MKTLSSKNVYKDVAKPKMRLKSIPYVILTLLHITCSYIISW